MKRNAIVRNIKVWKKKLVPDIRIVHKIRRLNWPEFYDAHRNGDVKNVPPVPRDRNETITLLLGCGRSYIPESLASPQLSAYKVSCLICGQIFCLNKCIETLMAFQSYASRVLLLYTKTKFCYNFIFLSYQIFIKFLIFYHLKQY